MTKTPRSLRRTRLAELPFLTATQAVHDAVQRHLNFQMVGDERQFRPCCELPHTHCSPKLVGRGVGDDSAKDGPQRDEITVRQIRKQMR